MFIFAPFDKHGINIFLLHEAQKLSSTLLKTLIPFSLHSKNQMADLYH